MTMQAQRPCGFIEWQRGLRELIAEYLRAHNLPQIVRTSPEIARQIGRAHV